MNNCPACKAEIKSSVWSANNLLPAPTVVLLNLANNASFESYCSKCSGQKVGTAIDKLKERMQNVLDEIHEVAAHLPILSLHNPQGWNYNPIGIITAQSVTGTGLVSELSATFNDAFGTESNTLNSKLKSGEDACFIRLRKRALELGANAILAVDINYAEIGSIRGMIMVCCTGTAVTLNNPEILGEETNAELSRLPDLSHTFNELQEVYSNYIAQPQVGN